jgi:hypothetical protein
LWTETGPKWVSAGKKIGEVNWGYAKEYVKLPSTSEGVSILGWTLKKEGGSSTEGGSNPEEGSYDPGQEATQVPSTQAPTAIPCTSGIPVQITQSLDLWYEGDTEGAMTALDGVPDYCVAEYIAANYYEPFSNGYVKLKELQQSEDTNERDIQKQAERLLKLNPRFEEGYSALAYAKALIWMGDGLSVDKAKERLTGATINIVKISSKAKPALLPSDADVFETVFSFDNEWGFRLSLLTRKNLNELEEALGLQKGALTIEGTTVKIPGSIYPDDMPEVSKIDLTRFEQPEATSTPAPTEPSVQNTPVPTAGSTGQVTCTYPGANTAGVQLRQWVAKVLPSISQEGDWQAFKAANRSAYQATQSNPNAQVDVVISGASTCPTP